jgi:DNA-binding CsgD family transcriptional regulator
MTDVIIFAESAIVRAGLVNLVGSLEGVNLVGVFGVVDEINVQTDQKVTWIVYASSRVIVLNLSPFLNALSAILVIVENGNAAPLIPKNLVAGWGMISSTISLMALHQAIQTVSNNLVVLSPEIASEMDTAVSAASEDDKLLDPLTGREYAVLEKLASGLANKQIAHTLTISENTVKFHITSIYSKLNVSSRTEAVRKAARLGLISL